MPIEINGLTHLYRSESEPIVALDHIDARIEDNSITFLVGHTGSGKSTLLRYLMGLIHGDAGTVLVDGNDLSTPAGRSKIRRLMGMAFQFPEKQLFEPTVREDIAFGPKNAGVGSDQIDSLVHDAMSAVGLDYQKYALLSPFSLSGGEQRRVALAGVIAISPKYLVLDEPTCGLDPVSRSSILDFISKMHDGGMTVIVSSHDMEAAARYATHVIALEHGHIAAQGTPAKFFSNCASLESIGLRVPKAAAFASKLRSDGFDIPNDVLDMDSLVQAIALNVQEGGAK